MDENFVYYTFGTYLQIYMQGIVETFVEIEIIQLWSKNLTVCALYYSIMNLHNIHFIQVSFNLFGIYNKKFTENDITLVL